MFACSRVVDRGTSNDDSPIPGAVLSEALNLCCKDASNIARIVKSCFGKLNNSFVTVRIKALEMLLHCAQLGPPAVVLEIRQYVPALNDCISWRGDPHPTRGFQPYDEMKGLCQTLLDIAYGNQPRAPKQAATPKFQFQQPAPQPQQPKSIMTPYEEQLAAQQAQQSFNTPFGSQQFQSRQGTYGATSNVAPSTDKGGVAKVTDWFKKTFAKKGQFSSFDDSRPQAPPQAAYGGMPQYAYNATYNESAYQRPAAQGPEKRENLATTTLTSDVAQRPVARREPGMSMAKPKRSVGAISPAKKLMKVTGGRAMANAQELTAFRDSFTAESIDELCTGLEDKDWKVKVRAILGLEVIAEAYGLPAVARAKQSVLSLTGSPQQSLRTAAIRFYAAIKDVEPAVPDQVSAFSFLGDQPDTEYVNNDEENQFIVQEEAPAAQEEPAAEAPAENPPEEPAAEQPPAEHKEEEEKKEEPQNVEETPQEE